MAGSSNTYKTGLSHVGSYLSAGIPWLKKIEINPGDFTSLNFYNVSKSIKVRNRSESGSLKIAFADFESEYVSRAIDFNDSGSGIDLESGNINLPSGNPFSFSFWVNIADADFRTRMFSTSTSNFNRIDVVKNNDTLVQFYLFVNGNSNIGSISVPNLSDLSASGGDLWTHVVLTSNGTSDNKLYVNGDLVITNTNSQPATAVNKVYLPASAGYYRGEFDELTYWSKQLSETEINELRNTDDYYEPSTHSAAGDLVAWWAFEDSQSDTDFNDDTTTTIQDRVGTNNLTGNGSLQFIDSPFGLGGVELNRNYLTLNAGSEITLNCKSKAIYLKAGLDFVQDIEIYASLTNIPSERMYDLTGPGIDE